MVNPADIDELDQSILEEFENGKEEGEEDEQ